MICEKCGKHFISRNLLLVHCCEIPIEKDVYNMDVPDAIPLGPKINLSENKQYVFEKSFKPLIIISEVAPGERSNLSPNYNNPDEIPQVFEPTGFLMVSVIIIQIWKTIFWGRGRVQFNANFE